MKIENASTTPSKSNQLRNVNTVLVQRGSQGTSPVNQGKSEVIAFVVNAGMNVTAYAF